MGVGVGVGVGVGAGEGVRERLLLGIVLMLHILAQHLLALECAVICLLHRRRAAWILRTHQSLAAGRAAENTKMVRELACQAL